MFNSCVNIKCTKYQKKKKNHKAPAISHQDCRHLVFWFQSLDMILINIFITLKCHLIFKPLWNWDIIFIPLKSAGLNHVLNNKYLLQFKCDAVVLFIRQKKCAFEQSGAILQSWWVFCEIKKNSKVLSSESHRLTNL